jgi:hypothetical protein
MKRLDSIKMAVSEEVKSLAPAIGLGAERGLVVMTA